jgi:4-amino-4-deoxychorismate lyase
MAIRTLVDGHETDCIPVDDRGLQYGDGLFETCVFRDGGVELWGRHRQRLLSGCRCLAMPEPAVAKLDAELQILCSGYETGLVKLILTRGSGGRGYLPPNPVYPRRLWQLFPAAAWPEGHYRQGVRLRLCRTRLGHNRALAGIKHLNRLEQVLARAEWRDPDIAEGLLQGQDGNWIEGTMSNLFLVSDGRLLTPDLSECGVAGVMRELVLELAAGLGVACRVQAIDTATLTAADEVFVTNSVIGLWPVVAVGDYRYRVGEVTRRVQAAIGAYLAGNQQK